MADANSAYTLADADHLKQLDEFYLMMIEQPLAHDDIIDHAAAASPAANAHLPGRMHPLGAPRRAGHPAAAPAASSISSWAAWADSREAKRVHDVAQAAGIPVWCGGMLEAGIGRAHNIALSTLPNFVLPGDVSASKRYWKRDIIQPPVETTPQGTIAVRDEPGFGYAMDRDFIRSTHRARGDRRLNGHASSLRADLLDDRLLVGQLHCRQDRVARDFRRAAGGIAHLHGRRSHGAGVLSGTGAAESAFVDPARSACSWSRRDFRRVAQSVFLRGGLEPHQRGARRRSSRI